MIVDLINSDFSIFNENATIIQKELLDPGGDVALTSR
jgi:hypothetical protein